MTSRLVVRSALCDGISAALRCELSRDSTDYRRPTHMRAKAVPARQSAAIPTTARTALHHDIPRLLGATPPHLAPGRIVVMRTNVVKERADD